MYRRRNPNSDLDRLIDAQCGVVSREQAIGLGLGRHSQARLVSSGQWQRLANGLLFAGPQPPGWQARAWAGVLLGGDSARLGGLAAAYLSGLVDDGPDTIVVLIPETARRQDRDCWAFRRERQGVRSRSSLGNPPRTTVADTVLDLCDGLLDETGSSPVHWITESIERRLATPASLRRALAARHFSRHRRLLSDLLDETDMGAVSALEVDYLRDVERAHGLPSGVRQAPRPTSMGERWSRRFRDVFYQEFGLIVELDGVRGHSGSARLDDIRRDNVSVLRGERTLRFGWPDVHDEPCLSAAHVAVGLIQGGWSGVLTRCRRCLDVPSNALLGF